MEKRRQNEVDEGVNRQYEAQRREFMQQHGLTSSQSADGRTPGALDKLFRWGEKRLKGRSFK